ncbi:MAG: aminoglycoside phosphotransferase family protein [Chloroflexota bacterium]
MITTIPWSDPNWLNLISAWITTQLAQRNIHLNGTITQPHTGMWSTVLHVPTDGGIYYCKASASSLAHEPMLTQLLANHQPHALPEIVAVDESQGWMLMKEGGIRLRELINDTKDIHHWTTLLPRYAQFQQVMAVHADTLLTVGAFDRRLASLPQQYEALLTDRAAMLIDYPKNAELDHLTEETYAQLKHLAPTFAQLCQDLAAFGIPETIQHDDFHDGNILVQNSTQTPQYIFFDWGDACVSHPFLTMLVTLRHTAYRLQLAEDAPELIQLRDAYLAAWRPYGSNGDLLEAFDLAYKIGMVCRALTWYAMVSTLPVGSAEWHENADSVPGWLLDFLDLAQQN